MTSADRTRQARKPSPGRRPDEPTALSETFVLLDNNAGSGPPSLLFADPVGIISAETPEEVPAALERLQAAVDGGLHLLVEGDAEGAQVQTARALAHPKGEQARTLAQHTV